MNANIDNNAAHSIELTHGSASPVGWDLGFAQILGSRHTLIEDSCAFRPIKTKAAGTGLYLAVADGVSGGARGEIASQAIVDHCMNTPPCLLADVDDLRQWLLLSEAVVRTAIREVSYSSGATTLAAAWLEANGRGLFIRVGDSRIYHISGNGVVVPLTEDQTYDNVGEQPPPNGDGNDLARMIGTGYMGEPEITPIALQPGEALLLCSDGLHRDLDEVAFASFLQNHRSLEQACIEMAKTARELGSQDDITVMVARRSPGLFRRLLHRFKEVD